MDVTAIFRQPLTDQQHTAQSRQAFRNDLKRDQETRQKILNELAVYFGDAPIDEDREEKVLKIVLGE